MVDFEKSIFFHREVIFHPVREFPRAVFDVKSVDKGAHVKIKNRLENSKKC